MAIKNVAIAGATGNVGQSILKALVDSNRFNITVLARSESASKAAIPGKFDTHVVDYADPDTLVNALTGHDAVVSALSSASVVQQTVLLEAAVRAGVARFIPSEFGSDTLNARAAALPVFANKKQMEQQIEALAAEGKISYTYVMNGPLLDFAMENSFLGLDLRKRQLAYLDGGVAKFSTTTRATVGKAVVEVLTKPDETSNRAVYVQDVALSMKDLLRLAKQALGDDGWTEVDQGSTEGMEKASYDKFAQGQKNMGVFVAFLLSAIFRDGYGGRFQKLDNELLGVSELKESDIVEVVREAAKAKAA